MRGVIIATCGHEVSEGISCAIDDGQIFSDGTKAVSYGTYCDKCIQDFHNYGKLRNKELSNILKELSKYKAAYEVLKEANEFYSKEKNWEGHDLYEFNGSAIEWDDTESLEPRGYKELIGGKCAREAKQKCEEILG